jgi:hypothetical protein
MTKKVFRKVLAEMARLSERMDELSKATESNIRINWEDDAIKKWHVENMISGKESAAVKRAALDLRRALSEITR